MRHAKMSLLILVSLALVALPSFAADQPGLSSDATRGEGGGTTSIFLKDDNCALIDFEGIGNNVPIGAIAGPVTVTFGASWLGLIDADDGGTGNFANEPSSFTAAYFLDTADISIALNPPVQFVSFFYSASLQSLPVTVRAYDIGGVEVDMATGDVIGTDFDGAPCVGDPTGQWCTWGSVVLSAAADNIASIEITGSVANQFAFDNMEFCTVEQELVYCCLDDLSCQQLSAEGCRAAGGVEVPTCENADCEAVPTEKSTWGSIKGSYR